MYSDIWNASVGEYLMGERVPFNHIYRYTVAVLKKRHCY